MKYLNHHPFAVEAFFERSTVLTFAVFKEDLESMIPDRFELDTYNDKYAFVAVAMVDAKGLRPKGMPSFLGSNFCLIGYRIFVRYINKAGRKMRGLYIIKSETDKRKMMLLGNVFTSYKYSLIDILTVDHLDSLEIVSIKSNFKVVINRQVDEIQLPIDSPFDSWKTAKRFAGPMPYTFSADSNSNSNSNSVIIVKGVRQNWVPKAIEIQSYKIGFIDSLDIDNIVLANAFEIENVPYHWEKGYIEKWK